MAYLPSQDEWNELLSAPHVARLTRAHGETDLELTLVARCRTLELKYALQSSRLNIFPFRSVKGVLGYGLIVPDDEVRPMVLWAACKDKSEYSILEDLNTENTLNIHLFNEACVNVASAKFCTKPGKQYGARLLSPSFEPDKDAIFADDVRSGIEAGILDAASMVTLTRLGPWYGAISHLIGGQRTPFALELLADEEGGHQEQLTGWLADSVQPDLLKNNLKYEDGKKNKEFADVTLSCTFRTVLVESKTLAILRRPQIPLRVDLHSDVDKKLQRLLSN